MKEQGVLRVRLLIFTAIGPVGLEGNRRRLLIGARRRVEVTIFARGRTKIDEERRELAVARMSSISVSGSAENSFSIRPEATCSRSCALTDPRG
jgi:hypothetical protein